MSESSGGDEKANESLGHWFAGKDVDVIIFRVNRRPRGSRTLFDERPKDVLTHMSQVLRGLEPIKSGRRYQREWRVGNLAVEDSSGSMTGMIGWSRSGQALSNIYDSDREIWVDQQVPVDASGVAPFAFIVGPVLDPAQGSPGDEGLSDLASEARFLGVLRHPSFAEDTLAHVFSGMLNRGEAARLAPMVTWAVEPVGDRDEFMNWLETTDTVTELQFVFKRPNPDGEPAFEELFERLDRLEAEKIRENITARDPDQGLSKSGLLGDATSMAYVAAAMAAFGFVVGKGRRNGKRVRYDQRSKALRRRVDDVSPEWDAATEEVRQAVRSAAERRQRDG